MAHKSPHPNTTSTGTPAPPSWPLLRPLLAVLDISTDPQERWAAVSTLLAAHYPFSLFTVLSFSPPTDVQRVYTTAPHLHPLGRRQPQTSSSHGHGDTHPSSENSTATPSPPKRPQWHHRLFVEGTPWIGSIKEDLRDVFEDWQLLWENGLGSVLNVPVRRDGITVGSLNLLGREHAYDGVDLGLAEKVAEAMRRDFERIPDHGHQEKGDKQGL